MYNQESQRKYRESFIALDVLAIEKKQLLEEILKNTKVQLSSLAMSGVFEHAASENWADFLKKVPSIVPGAILIVVRQEGQGFSCVTGSPDGCPPVEVWDQSLVQKASGRAQPLSLNWNGKETDIICLAQPIQQKNLDGNYFLLALINATKLIHSMVDASRFPYPFAIALINQEKVIFAESEALPPLQEIISLHSEDVLKGDRVFHSLARNIEERKIFKLLEEQRIGVEVSLDDVDLSMLVTVLEKDALKSADSQVSTSLFTLFLLVLLLGGGGTVWLTRRMAKPLQRLSQVMEGVESGDLNARYRKDWMGFEINVLGSHFNRTIDALTRHMETAKNERVAKEKLAQELKIGQEIQTSILPRVMPSFPGVEVAAGFLPAKEVGGDFYDVFVKKGVEGDGKSDQLMLAIADAAGKGVSACLYSLCVRSMLRSYEATIEELPKIIDATNSIFCLDTVDSGVFVTAWVGAYDATSRKLNYSCCGHYPALLIKQDGSLSELTTRGMALGVQPYEKVESASVQLHSGDFVLLYTDGVLEAHNSKNELFGKQRLMDCIRSKKWSSALELVNAVEQTVAAFAASTPQHDDVTLLVLRVL